MRRLLVIALLVAAVPPLPAGADAPAVREGAWHAVPLYGQLVRDYDAPDDPYAPGHRGVDVAAASGAPVRASAPGTVSFAGVVAGNRTVTVDHGDDVRTSYSFLATSTVATGAVVERGQVIGTVGDGHTPGAGSHVHLSARRGEFYFDPLWLYIGSSHADLLSITG